MKKISTYSVLLVVLLGFLSIALAQETIKPEDASKFIGHQKTVCGVVVSAHHITHRKGQPTFLKLRHYPNRSFTVVIRGTDRDKFEEPPERLYFGKEICVTGKILGGYQGKPEIIVKDPGQISIK